jgi:hypothetical protein
VLYGKKEMMAEFDDHPVAQEISSDEEVTSREPDPSSRVPKRRFGVSRFGISIVAFILVLVLIQIYLLF